MRLDLWLVKNKGVRSRSQAEEFIKRGDVHIFDPDQDKWIVAQKTSQDISEDFDTSFIKVESVLAEFVSRAGFKLKKALEHIKFNVSGLKCLDVGQSTGGFSQVLIDNKATLVVGLDVGTNQLNESLHHYKNLYSFEGLDIRNAKKNKEFIRFAPFDFCVVDVSFISLTQVLDDIEELLKNKGYLLALVKPQFELSREDLDKKGRVKMASKLDEVQIKITEFVKSSQKFQVLEYFPSALEGKDGNKEFFIYARKVDQS